MVHLNQDSAMFDFCRMLRVRSGCWYQRISLNKDRHHLLKPSERGKPVFYAVYKREYYKTFSQAFPQFVKEFPEFDGDGEGINVEFVEVAIRQGVDYIALLRPNEIKVIPPLLLYKFAKKHNLIRQQKKLNEYLMSFERDRKIVAEVVMCVPGKLLQDFEEVRF